MEDTGSASILRETGQTFAVHWTPPFYLSAPIRNVYAGEPVVYLVSPCDPSLYSEMWTNLMICDQALFLHSVLIAFRRLEQPYVGPVYTMS